MYISMYIYIYLLVGGTRKILVIYGWHGMKHLFFFVCLFIYWFTVFFWDIMRYGYIWYIPSGNLTVCYGTSPSLNRWIIYIKSVSKKMGIEKDERNNYSIQVPFEHQHYPKKVDFTTEIMRDEGAQHGATKDANTLLQPPSGKVYRLAKMAE